MQFEEFWKSLRFIQIDDRLLRLLDYQVPCYIVINTKDVVSVIHAKSYILHMFLTIGKIWKTCAESPTRKRIVESILLKDNMYRWYTTVRPVQIATAFDSIVISFMYSYFKNNKKMYKASKNLIMFLQHITDRTWSKVDATKPRTISLFGSTQYKH